MNQLSFCRHKTYTADALPLGTLVRWDNEVYIVAVSPEDKRFFVSLCSGGWEVGTMKGGVIVEHPVTLTPERS